MGSEPDINYQAPPASESTAAQLEAMTTGLPALMNALSEQYLPSERAKLAASQEVSPEYAKLAEQIYATTGMRLNEIGNAINDLNAKAQAETSADVVAGPGRRLVEEGLKTARIADPEYYKTRELAGARLAEMLNEGITPGESEAISRGVAKDRVGSGNANAPSNIEGIKAGMLYGNAANQKMSNALQLATGAMPTMKSGVNPFQTYPTASPNTGDTRATGAMSNLGQTVDNQGQNLLNQAGENQRAQIQSKTQLDASRMGGYRSGFENSASIIGSTICCFILLESYNGKLPWFVRACRDMYYKEEPILRDGYVKMANWLVPLMQKYGWIKRLVNYIMVKPLEFYGGYKFSVAGYKFGWLFKPVKEFWFSIWRNTAKSK